MKHIAFFSQLGHTISRAYTRFPFVLAFLLTIPYFILMVHEVVPVGPAAIAVIPLWLILGTALTVFMERLRQKKVWSLVAHIVLVGLLVTLTAWIQTPSWTDSLSLNEGMFLAQLGGLSWLLLLAAMLFRAQGTFWKQAVELLTRLLLTIFFGIVIFGILAIALQSVDYLMGLHLDGKVYFDLWLLVTGIFGPLFMLGGFPHMVEEDALNEKIGGFLQGIAKYILFPASLLYFAILYAYSAKILLTHTWPTGTLAFMILGFSSLLIVSYGLLYGKIEQMRRGALWTKLLFAGLVPQIIMLFITAGIRIEDVGLTEKRYLLLLAGIWLTIIAGYYIFSHKRRLEAIPLVLLVLTFLSMFGPWSMLEASKNSQVAELQRILQEHKALQNGKVVQQSFEDSYAVRSILQYLKDHDALSSIQPWFAEDISNKYADDIAAMIDSNTSGGNMYVANTVSCTLQNDRADAYKNIAGYTYELSLPTSDGTVHINDNSVNYDLRLEGTNLSSWRGTDNLGSMALDPFMQDALSHNCIGDPGFHGVPLSTLTYHYENARIKVQIVFDELMADKEKEGPFKNIFFQGTLYVTFK